MVRRFWPIVTAFGLACAGAVGCGGDQPAPNTENEARDPAASQPKKSGFGVSQELGALDEAQTTATFEKVSSKLDGCYKQGLSRIPYLGGEVHFVVRIAESGSAKWAFLKDSTLGDRETEECMLSALRSAPWPKPVGGEGVAQKGLTFDPGGDERPPVAWTADRLGTPLAKAKGALSACKSEAGTGGMTVTMYVATNGKPQAVGVSTADEKGEKAVSCVVSALKGVAFPSPGSWAAKVSFPIE